MTGTGGGKWVIPNDGWNAAKNEFTIMLVEPAPEQDNNLQVSVDIAFGDVESLTGKPVLPVLDHFGQYAHFVIVQLIQDAKKIAGV